MKILIVEDNEDSRVLQETTLEAQGHTVESAVNGKQALETAMRSRPDLIISDILMPEMDGFALCQAVKEDEQLRTVPFIFYTASYITPEDEKLAKTLGATRFIIKTGDTEEFLKAIEDVIKEYKEGGPKVPGPPAVGKEELDRMHKEALVRQLDKKVRELEKEHEALKESEEELKTHARQQEVISKLGLDALKETDLQELMNETVSVVAKTLDMEYCKVLELLPDGEALLLRAGVGWKKGLVGHATVGAEKHSQAGYTLLSHGPVVVEDLRTEKRFEGPPLLIDHGVVSGMSVVIHEKDKPFGVFGVHTSKQRTFTKYDVDFFQTVANILAETIGREKAGERLKNALRGTIQALATTVETRDPYTAGHQQRVTVLACAVATEIGLSGEKIEGLRMAGIIHDVGKMGVPAEILTKPGRISATEFEIIKTHPQVGYDILKGIEFPWPVAEIVLQHQERMDGSGYPRGLSGDDILMEARIIAVADTVEAMASHRPYRAALGIDAALEEVTKNKGTRYDADVVDACVRLFREKGFAFK